MLPQEITSAPAPREARRSRGLPSDLAGGILTVCTYVGRVVALVSLAMICLFVFQGDFGIGFEGKALFYWHPLLMVFAFSVCMTEAVFAYMTHPCTEVEWSVRKWYHVAVHSVTVACVIAGVACLAVSEFQEGNPPYPKSSHSFIGTLTVVLFFLQYILGGVHYFRPAFPKDEAKAEYTPFHVFLGLVIYFLGLTTIMLGFTSKTIPHGTLLNQQLEVAKGMMPVYVLLGLVVAYHFRTWTKTRVHTSQA